MNDNITMGNTILGSMNAQIFGQINHKTIVILITDAFKISITIQNISKQITVKIR